MMGRPLFLFGSLGPRRERNERLLLPGISARRFIMVAELAASVSKLRLSIDAQAAPASKRPNIFSK